MIYYIIGKSASNYLTMQLCNANKILQNLITNI